MNTEGSALVIPLLPPRGQERGAVELPHTPEGSAIQGGGRSRVRFARLGLGAVVAVGPIRNFVSHADKRQADADKEKEQPAMRVEISADMAQASNSKGSRIGTKGVGLPLSYTTCQYCGGRRAGSCFAQQERGRQSHRPFSS